MLCSAVASTRHPITRRIIRARTCRGNAAVVLFKTLTVCLSHKLSFLIITPDCCSAAENGYLWRVPNPTSPLPTFTTDRQKHMLISFFSFFFFFVVWMRISSWAFYLMFKAGKGKGNGGGGMGGGGCFFFSFFLNFSGGSTETKPFSETSVFEGRKQPGEKTRLCWGNQIAQLSSENNTRGNASVGGALESDI